jgi:2-iminobutanoate/2-iminopropanoate deaminase
MKTVFSSPHAPPALGPYSQAIGAGAFIFCSGQVPLEAGTGELVGQDVPEQTKQALLNLGAVYATFFSVAPPARSTIEVSGLPLGPKVEIEAIAVKPS